VEEFNNNNDLYMNEIIVSKDDINITRKDILDQFENTALSIGYQDIENIKASQFRYLCNVVGHNLGFYNGNRYLLIIETPNDPMGIDKQYNFTTLNNILNVFIEVCTMYSKSISIANYSALTGIPENTLCEWGNNSGSLQGDIYKRLRDGRQSYLSDKLEDSSNIVGTIAVVNHEYGWNSDTSGNTSQRINVISVSDLPRLKLNADKNANNTGNE
jgi:hypothetical protein